MKTVLYYCIVLILIISSCATPRYVHDFKTSRVLDFRTGKWLVNNIETNLSGKAKKYLTENLLRKLNKINSDSIIYIDTARLYFSLPNQILFKTPNETLELLKLTTNFDYLVSVKTQENRDEMGSFLLSSPLNYKKNEAEVSIVVYELKTGSLIYSQRIIGTVELDVNDPDVRISKSASGLIFGALDKGLKEMKKNAIR